MPDLTDTILTTASLLMGKYGISSVTMDDIAKECHISKRTLYEKIPDKRTLVWYCVLFSKKKRQEEAKNMATKSNSTLDALLHIYRHMRTTMSESSNIFFKDMHRLYPDLEKRCREMHIEQAHEFGNFLKQGINEGMFHQNVNLNTAAQVFLIQSEAIINVLGISNEISTVCNMMDTAFVIFLRGIATAKGLDIIDKFISENNILNN